jgi:hypothetical protein
MLQRIVGIQKSICNTILFSKLWAYWTSIRSTIGFTPFQLVYVIEAIFPIECEIPSLKLVVKLLCNTLAEEERILYLMRLDETFHDATPVIKTQKKHLKDQYEKHVKPRVFYEGDLVILYKQYRDLLGVGKFKLMWQGPYIVK